MGLKERIELQRLSRRRSQLVSWGAVLVALAFVAPRPLSAVAAQMQGMARSLTFIAADLFRAAFFVGVAFLIIGRLRNRRWKREAAAARDEDDEGAVSKTGKP